MEPPTRSCRRRLTGQNSAMSKIERSNQAGRFTEAEIRGFIDETKRRQSQPGYAEREARRLRDTTAALPPTRFPELAKRATGQTPALDSFEATFDLIR